MRQVNSIPDIIKNLDGLYEGNLRHYLRVTMMYAKNLQNPYHNFRHVFHVVWLCYTACLFYGTKLTPREMRNLLIAAMFHDFDHPGKTGNDDLNIEIAIRGLRKHLAQEDVGHLSDIEALIRPTQFPYVIDVSTLSLSGQILRDADASQAFSVAWVQQIVFGLAEEMGTTPHNVFAMQEGFLTGLHFATEWGCETFTQKIIDEKVEEAKGYMGIIQE